METAASAGPSVTEHVPCAICGGRDVTVFVRGTDTGSIVRCRRDGLLYASPRSSRAEIERSFDAWAWELHEHLPARTAALQREAAAIKALKSGGALLDVGCATGLFFRYFQDPQWQRFGVEPSRQSADYAREHFHADVVCGLLGDGHWKPASFDVVSIIDAFYYFPDPATALTAVHRLLKADGLLALEIPGYTYRMIRERGPLCLLLSGAWHRMAPGRQLYYYSPRTLAAVLQKTGFEVIEMLPQPAPTRLSKTLNAVISLHLVVARLLSWVTRGRVSVAAKELYLCRKIGTLPES